MDIRSCCARAQCTGVRSAISDPRCRRVRCNAERVRDGDVGIRLSFVLLLPACSLPLSHAQADQGFILKPSFSFPARYSNGPSSTSVVLLELFFDPMPRSFSTPGVPKRLPNLVRPQALVPKLRHPGLQRRRRPSLRRVAIRVIRAHRRRLHEKVVRVGGVALLLE